MGSPIIRPILKKDNEQIAVIIRSVLEDFGVPKIGSAYADVSLDAMFENYNVPGAAYFVLENNGKLIGGGGVAQLENYKGKVCELQKMYFLPEARGKGFGTKMIDTCLQSAQDLGYTHCYLETMSYMEAAQKLYKKYGFEYLDGPMGDTGHYACGVHMIKAL